ncbi:ATP-binding protein [uncultured Kordia sp.]|uniref:tetratricopeptide repeat-containing hybrid sensor histidine kinase/response regulator n=1 Tax=uncultured Kordia sp. TaxID=507699 RepID=UPI0026349739|nr:ATP-binding protein [uncultured Kordia sp.]
MKNNWKLHIVLCIFACLQAVAQPVDKDSIRKLNENAFDLTRKFSFGKSLSYSYLAIQYSINNDDDESLASSYNTLGITYNRMHYYNKAQKYYEKALEIHEAYENKKQIVLLNHYLARISIDRKNYGKANEYLDLAYKIAKETGDPENELVLDWVQIDLYQLEGEYTKVVKHVDGMYERIKIASNKAFYIARKNYLGFVLGDAYYHLKDYEKAEKYLEKHTKDEYVHSNDLAVSFMQLSDIYKSKGEIDKFKEAQEKYQENLKKKLNTDHQRLKEELLMNYSLNKDKLKLDVLEQKNKRQNAIVNRSKIFVIIIVILLLVCIALVVLLIKTIYKKIKSNKLLRIKHNKLEEAKLKAEMTSKTKSNFFSMMSHELRTPLYAVTGITHLLLEENPKPSQKQYLKSLKFSGDHLLSLVNNILQANKLEDNTITIGASTFNLKTNIDNILKSFDLLIKERENELHIAYDKEIPELLVGDSLKISQILINLISNAIKFTKGGAIRLSVEKVEENLEDVLLHFCVQDTGIGIPKEKQEKVFEMFSQNYDAINEEYQGSGLGLSIVKKLLEVYNSDIHLESEENKGTTFTFDIRFPKTTEAVNTIGDFDLDGVNFSQLKMLVVDDNRINQMLTKKILSTKNITTDIVASGAEAIEAVKESNYDVILMDIHMPEMDGYQATKAIRKFNKEVPIIAFTAVSLDDSFHKIIDSGMNDMILKPFVASQLFTLIHKHMK